jgi:hypothetical protein
LGKALPIRMSLRFQKLIGILREAGFKNIEGAGSIWTYNICSYRERSLNP